MADDDRLSPLSEQETTVREGRYVGFLNDSEFGDLRAVHNSEREVVLGAIEALAREFFSEDKNAQGQTPGKSLLGEVEIWKGRERAYGSARTTEVIYLSSACTPLDAISGNTQDVVTDFSKRFREKVENEVLVRGYSVQVNNALRAVAMAVERAALPSQPTFDAIPTTGLAPSPISRPGRSIETPTHGLGGDNLGFKGITPRTLD